jgi:hypothetical protein
LKLDDAAQLMNVSVDSAKRGGDRRSNQSANLHFGQAEAARALSVSPRSVKSANKVLKHGDKELAASVQSGAVSVSAAAQSVDAATKYPEVAAIKGARHQDRVTIAGNLDKLPEEW